MHFINGGMKVLGGGSVKVEFATRGPADSFFCKMGRGDLVPCELVHATDLSIIITTYALGVYVLWYICAEQE